MSDYDSLAALRRALTAEDPDRRANAYGAVMRIDMQVSSVLDADPDDDAVAELVENDVIPEPGPGARGRSIADREEEIVELLKEIRDGLGGGEA